MFRLSRTIGLATALLMMGYNSSLLAQYSSLSFGMNDDNEPYCPPSEDYKWPPAPDHNQWTNPNNYTSWNGPTDLGCVSQGDEPIGYSTLVFGVNGDNEPYCPPSEDYKWPPAPDHNQWTNPNNYTSWTGPTDLGCVSQGDGIPDSTEPEGFSTLAFGENDDNEPYCPPSEHYKWPPAPDHNQWTNPSNYEGWTGPANLGCVSQGDGTTITGESIEPARNTYNRVANDGALLDFEYMNDTPMAEMPFEWRTTNGSNNKYYSFFNEGDGVDHNDSMLTTVLDGVNSGSASPDYVSNSHSAENGDLLGDFRIKCQWSHFAYDDPIVFSNTDPDDPRSKGRNKSHLHMFWGNTAIDWDTNLTDKNDPNYIAAHGGSSCNGGALNRSSYWMPALMHNNDHAMTPKEILVYYKTWEEDDPRSGERAHHPSNTNRMPQGLQLIAGNGNVPDGSFDQSEADRARNLNLRMRDQGFRDTNENIYWACGDSDGTNKKFNRIPTFAEWNTAGCQDNWYLNATIYFPQCMQNENEIRSGFPHRNHVTDTVAPDRGCPVGTGFEHRIPRLGYLLYWDVMPMITAQRLDANTEFSIDNLRLSSDPTTFNNTGDVDFEDDSSGLNKYRGGTLHADWVAAWHDKVMDIWIDHCTKDAVNCSTGQTGTGISLRSQPEDYEGKFGIGSNDPTNYLIEVPTGSMIGAMGGM